MTSTQPPGGSPAGPPPGKAGARGRGGSAKRASIKFDSGQAMVLREGFAYQYGSDVAWDVDRKEAIRISHLRHTFSHQAVKHWMESAERRMVYADQVVFDPSETCGAECVNLWTGWGVEPVAGDVTPFFELLRHIACDDETVIDYVLNWYAIQLQRPGIKLKTALVFHGPEGSGKNLLNETVAAIFGRHGRVVGQRELESQWTDWQSGCQFLIGDEVVSRADLRHHKGMLKGLITSEHLNIATKFLNLRTERNCMNLVFHSNEVEPLKLDPTDRRYLVIWTAKRGDQGLYDRFVRWREGGGAARLFAWLLARDLTGWAWYEPPPMTEAKQDLIELGRLSPERFYRAWKGDEIQGLPYATCSVEQIYRAYKRWALHDGERAPMVKPQFSRLALREAGDDVCAKVCRIGLGPREVSTRVWFTSPPPEGWGIGPHAQACIRKFDAHLQAYLHRNNPNQEADE